MDSWIAWAKKLRGLSGLCGFPMGQKVFGVSWPGFINKFLALVDVAPKFGVGLRGSKLWHESKSCEDQVSLVGLHNFGVGQ